MALTRLEAFALWGQMPVSHSLNGFSHFTADQEFIFIFVVYAGGLYHSIWTSSRLCWLVLDAEADFWFRRGSLEVEGLKSPGWTAKCFLSSNLVGNLLWLNPTFVTVVWVDSTLRLFCSLCCCWSVLLCTSRHLCLCFLVHPINVGEGGLNNRNTSVCVVVNAVLICDHISVCPWVDLVFSLWW